MTFSHVPNSHMVVAHSAPAAQEANQFPEQTSISWGSRIVTELQNIKNDAASGYNSGMFENGSILYLTIAFGANLILFPALEKYGLNESIFNLSLGEHTLVIGATIAFQLAAITVSQYGSKTAGAVTHAASGIAKRSGIIG